MRGLLQLWTKSSIILTSKEESVWRNQKAQKQDRFLCGMQIACLIYEYFRVTGVHDSIEKYADLFIISLRNDDIQESDSKWDGILLFMTKIALDDMLERLYKLIIRESALETHQKKLRPDYHRLKIMVKRSIEQEIRNKNFGTRSGNFEKNAVVKNQGTKQRIQRILGDCWQWETNGHCVKGDNCSFRHDINKRWKITASNPSPNSFMQQNERTSSRTRSFRGRSPSGRMSRWLHQRNLQQFILWKVGTPPECLFCRIKSGLSVWGKSARMHIVRLMNSRLKGPKRMTTKVQWLCWKGVIGKKVYGNLLSTMLKVKIGQGDLMKKSNDKRGSSQCRSSNARQLGGVFQDMTPPKLILRKCTDMHKPIQRVKFTKAVARHTKIRDKILRSDTFVKVNLMSAAPTLPNLTIGLKRRRNGKSMVPREVAWKLVKSVFHLKEWERATFFSPSENRCLPASNRKPEEREFVVDSGASMHMISKKDLSDAVMDTLTTSCSPTIVITANGEVQTHEEATVYVKEFGCILDYESPRKHASSICRC